MSDPSEEKKIIVDEDWKTRVQAEKEAAATAGREKSDEPGGKGADSASQDVPLPPASLEILITSLATQTMIPLGILPNPATNKSERRPNEARHLIDLIAMLQEKTEGNRTPGESALLEDTLHQLRMAYVSVFQASPPGSPATG